MQYLLIILFVVSCTKKTIQDFDLAKAEPFSTAAYESCLKNYSELCCMALKAKYLSIQKNQVENWGDEYGVGLAEAMNGTACLTGVVSQ